MGALVALTLTATGLSACGASSDEAAIKVAGSPITKATIEHWVPIEAVVSVNTIPVKAVPKGALPDPPSYSACVAWLGTPTQRLATGIENQSVAQKKAGCKKRLAELKEKVAAFLMIYQWEKGQAAEEGLKVSEAEIEKDLRRFQRVQTPGAGEFQQYLTNAHMKLADAQFIQRITITGTLVNNAIQKKAHPQQAVTDFTRKWTSRTDCKPAWVIPGCRQYKGRETPL